MPQNQEKKIDSILFPDSPEPSPETSPETKIETPKKESLLEALNFPGLATNVGVGAATGAGVGALAGGAGAVPGAVSGAGLGGLNWLLNPKSAGFSQAGALAGEQVLPAVVNASPLGRVPGMNTLIPQWLLKATGAGTGALTGASMAKGLGLQESNLPADAFKQAFIGSTLGTGLGAGYFGQLAVRKGAKKETERLLDIAKETIPDINADINSRGGAIASYATGSRKGKTLPLTVGPDEEGNFGMSDLLKRNKDTSVNILDRVIEKWGDFDEFRQLVTNDTTPKPVKEALANVYFNRVILQPAIKQSPTGTGRILDGNEILLAIKKNEDRLALLPKEVSQPIRDFGKLLENTNPGKALDRVPGTNQMVWMSSHAAFRVGAGVAGAALGGLGGAASMGSLGHMAFASTPQLAAGVIGAGAFIIPAINMASLLKNPQLARLAILASKGSAEAASLLGRAAVEQVKARGLSPVLSSEHAVMIPPLTSEPDKPNTQTAALPFDLMGRMKAAIPKGEPPDLTGAVKQAGFDVSDLLQGAGQNISDFAKQTAPGIIADYQREPLNAETIIRRNKYGATK